MSEDRLRIEFPKTMETRKCDTDLSLFINIERILRDMSSLNFGDKDLVKAGEMKSQITSLMSKIDQKNFTKFDATGIEDIPMLVDRFIESMTATQPRFVHRRFDMQQRVGELMVENSFRLTECIVGEELFKPINEFLEQQRALKALKRLGASLK